MPGPPPNPNARRRNDRNAGFTVLPAEKRRKAPRMPGTWLQGTKKVWEAWWASPMASQWSEADIPQLLLMARMYEQAMEGDSKAFVEFRQWADRFGLSNLARLKNRWLLPDDDKAVQAAEQADVSNVIRLAR